MIKEKLSHVESEIELVKYLLKYDVVVIQK